MPSAAEEDLRLASSVDLPVLITASSQRLRNACARLIHVNGRRARGPFVAVAADEPDVDRHFEQAALGTLFIDDIVRLDDPAQSTLLRLLDARFSPDMPQRRLVRVITGASRHLTAERRTGHFSDELFYRLNAVHINLAPPRRRNLR
jgi:DNA-binding NtrC family response regulator